MCINCSVLGSGQRKKTEDNLNFSSEKEKVEYYNNVNVGRSSTINKKCSHLFESNGTHKAYKIYLSYQAFYIIKNSSTIICQYSSCSLSTHIKLNHIIMVLQVLLNHSSCFCQAIFQSGVLTVESKYLYSQSLICTKFVL